MQISLMYINLNFLFIVGVYQFMKGAIDVVYT